MVVTLCAALKAQSPSTLGGAVPPPPWPSARRLGAGGTLTDAMQLGLEEPVPSGFLPLTLLHPYDTWLAGSQKDESHVEHLSFYMRPS